MANTELGGSFKKAILAWVDPAADPTKGVEQASVILKVMVKKVFY